MVWLNLVKDSMVIWQLSLVEQPIKSRLYTCLGVSLISLFVI
jgi:hypothetical protein